MSCSSRRSSSKNKDVPLDRSSSGSGSTSSNSIVVMVVGMGIMHFRKDHGVVEVVLLLEEEEGTGTTSMESLDGRRIVISWGKHSFRMLLWWGREFVVVVVTGHSSIWGRYSYGLLFVVDEDV